MRKIKLFGDGTVIEQGRGQFDDYCVFVTRPGEECYAPRDVDYFSFFKEKAKEYTADKIYADFVRIYDRTTSEVEVVVLDEIDAICVEYNESDRLEFNIWYSVIYLGMVAEEKKKNAILKKRIKRLGMHQLLFENMTAEEAAFFSYKKKATYLSQLCADRGF